MRKLLATAIAVLMAVVMPMTAFAAAQELGSDDFVTRVSGKSSTVSKNVRTKSTTYKITGLYYPDEGKEVFNILNQERAAAGLKKLKWESGLVQPAIQRALEQYVLYNKNPPLSHIRPNGSSWSTVSSLANGENLAGGDANAEDVMVGWMNSTSHREAILNEKFTSVACVCVETDQMVYWVQLFHADSGKSSTSSSVDEEDSSSTDTKTSGVTAKSIAASLDKAKTSAAATSVMFKDTEMLPVAALKAAADWGAKNKKSVAVTTTTLAPGSVNAQGRITLNPASFVNNKNDLKTGVHVDESAVSGVQKSFNKWYPKNTVAVIRFDQSGSFGGTVRVGAKLSLTGLDTSKLVFYHYDKSTNKISKMDLGKAGYTIDKNKYLNFDTSKGGYIIVTDKELRK